MQVFSSKLQLTEWLESRKSNIRALVPTMGSLHEGHISLFNIARSKVPKGDVIVTIYVNPTQFDKENDFKNYPKSIDDDLIKCKNNSVDAVFIPNDEEMYFSDSSIIVSETSLSKDYCGISRLGHFDGVVTIVTKLFILINPQFAVFGEKDFQQLTIIKRLVRDLFFPIKILSGTTVREANGIAMSSRNSHLDKDHKDEVSLIYKYIIELKDNIKSTPKELIEKISNKINSLKYAKIDYINIVDEESLASVATFKDNSRLLIALNFPKTRIIDNIKINKLL